MKIIVLSTLFLMIPIHCADETKTSRVQSYLYSIGTALNNIELPFVGKLEGILPFAVMSFCLQKFPGQTLAIVSAVALYALYKNNNVLNLLQKYNFIKKPNQKRVVPVIKSTSLEDDFFVFEDDLLAAEEEDEEEELMDDTEHSKHPYKKPVKKEKLNFL